MKPQVVTALYQRHSAILGQFLLGHQPLEAEIDLRQRPNPPLETEVGTPRSETGPCDCANALWQRLLFTYSMQKRHEKKAVCAQLSEENYATNGYSHRASKQLGISAASARWPALRLRPWWRWHAPWHGRARASSASVALMSDSACLRSAVARTTSSWALDCFSSFGFHS